MTNPIHYQSIVDAFQSQVARRPDACAVVHGETTLSYAQLEHGACRLAEHLLANGVQHGQVVAVNMERSPELIVALLAILKAGAAYYPIDRSDPLARTRNCMRTAQVRLLLTDEKQREGDKENEFADVAADLIVVPKVTVTELIETYSVDNPLKPFSAQQHVKANDRAYVMFTSGSTGDPKGVLVPHRAVLRLVKNTNYIHISEQDALLQFAPISFDASTFEIWGALLNGACLVLYSGTVLDPNRFKRDIADNGVTIMWLTAALFHMVAENFIEALTPLHTLLAGGDVLNPKYVRKVLDTIDGIKVINGYGPTENTTFTCCHVMSQANAPEDSVPIGKAISGTQIHILDDEFRPVSSGEDGELFVSGAGVALGYINADNSDNSFFAEPSIANGLLYRTGDLVRANNNGELLFLGRKDNQLKIRGYRISLEEIRCQLLKHDDVQDALVLKQNFEGGEQLLVAHLKVKDCSSLDADQMRMHLNQYLPRYMIPDNFIFDTTLPINKNGKVDAKALAYPSP